MGKLLSISLKDRLSLIEDYLEDLCRLDLKQESPIVDDGLFNDGQTKLP